MRILINTASTLKGGGLQVASSFLQDCKMYSQNEYHVILSPKLAGAIEKDNFPANFFFYNIDFRPATKVISFQSHDSFFKKLEKKINPDVVFTTTGPAYWRPKAPHVVGYNLPHHVYPESPYMQRLSTYRRIRWKVKRIFVKYFFRRDADCIVVQTDDVKKRLQKLLKKDNIITVSNTYSPYFNYEENCPSKLAPKFVDEFRLLTLSAWYPHKNFEIIPKVVAELLKKNIKNVKFILTIPIEVFDKIIPKMYSDIILTVGPVSMREAPSLYKECDAMFLPTLLECFSASYAEAMAVGKPIITSNMGFAKTVCNDAAIYFNPIDPLDISNKIAELVYNKALQNEMKKRGKERMSIFGTSKQRTNEYLKICKDLVDRRRASLNID